MRIRIRLHTLSEFQSFNFVDVWSSNSSVFVIIVAPWCSEKSLNTHMLKAFEIRSMCDIRCNLDFPINVHVFLPQHAKLL